ncbi:MAG: hypothetical protein R2690_00170 [Acidimicrobiales bacterium]
MSVIDSPNVVVPADAVRSVVVAAGATTCASCADPLAANPGAGR